MIRDIPSITWRHSRAAERAWTTSFWHKAELVEQLYDVHID
jgi:hypothetical protein